MGMRSLDADGQTPDESEFLIRCAALPPAVRERLLMLAEEPEKKHRAPQQAACANGESRL